MEPSVARQELSPRTPFARSFVGHSLPSPPLNGARCHGDHHTSAGGLLRDAGQQARSHPRLHLRIVNVRHHHPPRQSWQPSSLPLGGAGGGVPEEARICSASGGSAQGEARSDPSDEDGQAHRPCQHRRRHSGRCRGERRCLHAPGRCIQCSGHGIPARLRRHVRDAPPPPPFDPPSFSLCPHAPLSPCLAGRPPSRGSPRISSRSWPSSATPASRSPGPSSSPPSAPPTSAPSIAGSTTFSTRLSSDPLPP